MRIGVSGASGQLGRAVLAELATRAPQHGIIGVSRTPEGLPAGVEGRRGDYDRPGSLASAYAGLDRLLIIPSGDLTRGRRGAQNVTAIDAAIQAGVGHIVLMSSAGTREEHEPSIGASYWLAEQHLISSAPSWTTLRMNYYAEALAQEAQMSLGMGVLTGLEENRVGFVSREDVAAAAVGILAEDGHEGAIYTATGPDRVSGADRAAMVAELTGKPMGFMVLPEAQLRAGMAQAGLPEDVVNGWPAYRPTSLGAASTS